jgi:Patatin-like phospholipase
MAGQEQANGAAKKLLSTEEMLGDEAQAIHGKEAETVVGQTGAALYQALNNLNSAALCLSGGGIRSAAFALGVIQALAVHPRPAAKEGAPADLRASADDCLLGRFHYLSTVSGGGYIGSWLTAGIARTSFATMWQKLVDRKPRPEDEAPQIAWLRAYSNYLTPKLGLTSADTWTAIALYVRNLILNWLIVVPALCAALIAIKLLIAGAYGLSDAGVEFVVAIALVGAALQIWALRFALLHRPTRPVRKAVPPEEALIVRELAQAENRGEQQENERVQAVGRGTDQRQFLRRDLVPSVLAASLFNLAFWPDVTDPLLAWPLWWLIVAGLAFGFMLYAISWIAAWPWPLRDPERGAGYWAKDFLKWSIAGGVYGAIIGFGIFLLGAYDFDILVGNVKVTDETQNALLLFIYGVPWIITAQLTAEMVFVGLTSLQIDSDADREWFGRSTGWFTAVAITWVLVSFLVLVGAGLVFALYAKAGAYLAKTAGGVGGAVSGIVTAILGKSKTSPAYQGAGGKSWTSIILAVTTPIFIAALVVGFSALLDDLLLDHSLLQSPLIGGPATPQTPLFSAWEDFKWLLVGLAVALFIAWLASKNVNINRFSLHALYRNRIIRAFLGATNPGRNPDSFTGFDERDNPPMTSLWPEGRMPGRLFHVINMALNAVSSQRLAWQERKAESFIVSPRHAGSAYKAYRRSDEYANGISVGTAVAISGAAASPNMGYHSSPAVTILLALFNVRLGWWLGNPGTEGDATYTSEGPATAIKPLFDEMLGRTTDENPYVYLSDGGHFENLGLYEMVRRRCRFIIVSDAGCDKDFQFEDLGNAVRKIWLDLGVPIRFAGLNALRYRAADDGKYGPYEPPFQAIGTIDYPAADGPECKAGTILYIKPCFHRNRIENVGVRNYATLNPDFPHQSTADQFFSESQFESYRALGFEMTDNILKQALKSSSLPAGAGLDQIFALMPQTAAPGP